MPSPLQESKHLLSDKWVSNTQVFSVNELLYNSLVYLYHSILLLSTSKTNTKETLQLFQVRPWQTFIFFTDGWVWPIVLSLFSHGDSKVGWNYKKSIWAKQWLPGLGMSRLLWLLGYPANIRTGYVRKARIRTSLGLNWCSWRASGYSSCLKGLEQSPRERREPFSIAVKAHSTGNPDILAVSEWPWPWDTATTAWLRASFYTIRLGSRGSSGKSLLPQITKLVKQQAKS